jgi:hypothetical protein
MVTQAALELNHEEIELVNAWNVYATISFSPEFTEGVAGFSF